MSSGTSKSVHAIRIVQKNNMLHVSKRLNSTRRLDGITRRMISSSSSQSSKPSTTAITRNTQNIICNNNGSRRSISSICAKASFNHKNSDGSSNIIPSITALTVILTAAITCQDNKNNNKSQENNIIHCDSTTVASGLATTTNPLFKSENKKSQPRNVMLHRMRSVRARQLGEKYKVDWNTCLGEGAYAQVFPAKTDKGEKVALKRIAKKYTNSSSFHIETNALLRIYDNGGHPNISGLRDMYEDDDDFYLVMDLVSGGEMFDHLINYGAYSEADASRLIHEIASALTFLHGVGVVHADLKPENMLLCSKNKSDGTIQLIDFGCSVVYQDNFHDYLDDGPLYEDFESQSGKGPIKNKGIFSTGTTAYWPPERFKGAPVDAASDMWSIGIILYIMLVGCHPFDITGASSDDEIARRIRKNPVPAYGELTDHLTPSALDLIQNLLEADPNRRLTAKDMLMHPWVRGETATTSVIAGSDKKLSRFTELRRKLEAGIFTILVSQSHKDAVLSEAKVDDKDDNRKGVNIMKKAFASFDEEGKGYVSKDDLARVLGQVTKTELTSSESEELTSLLSELSSQEQDGLSLSDFSQNFSRLKHKNYPRGHVIFKAGDMGDSMYFLNAGKVQIETKKGERVAILHSGDFFGEGSLLNKENRRFTTAKCATPVDVIKISRKDFDSYIASSDVAKQELKIKWTARSLKYAKTLIRLQKNLELRTFQKGEAVYEEGDIGKSMFFVREHDGGELDVRHDGVKVHAYSGGDSFGESSLLFSKPRSSTVTCISETCKLNEMQGSDFLALMQSTPDAAASLLDMCRKRYFKKAVKKINRGKQRSFDENDLVAAFNDADTSGDGRLSLDEIRLLMKTVDSNFPETEVVALMKFLDVDETGEVSLEEFKRMFRVFERMEE